MKMNKLILALIIFASCGGGGSSQAQPCGDVDCPIGIKMVHINSELNFNLIDSEKIMNEAINFLNTNTTLTFNYVGAISMEDLNPETATLENFLNNKKRFRDYETFFWDNPNVGGNYKNREFTMIIDRPLIDSNGIRYTAGRAKICALYERGSIGVSYVTPLANPRPTSASYKRPFSELFNRAVTVTAHEIGHLSGAYHKDSCPFCIMHPSGGHDAFAEVNTFKVSEESNNEMEVCVRRETRRAIISCRDRTNKRRKLRRCKKRKGVRHVRLKDVKFVGVRSLEPSNTASDLFGD